MLLFGEVQVRARKCVESKTLTYVGLVDYGEGGGETSALANHGLVFMFCPFGKNYAQPIGVFASRGATKGTILSHLVLQAIVMLEKAGAIVDGIVCDGASTNRKMWSELGVNGKLDETKHFIEHPMCEDRKVYVFSDVPHLFKCIRNRLLKQRLLNVKGEWVKWWFYAAVYKEDLKNAGGLKVCPNITSRHVHPSNMDLMRVKLVTQVFSRCMASAIIYYTERNVFNPLDTAGTVEFTGRMNDLFDSMNRRHPGEAVHNQIQDILVLKESLQWLNDWERDLNSGVITKDMFLTATAEGLRVSILSTLDLAQYLLTECGFNCTECSPCTVLKPPKFGNCEAREQAPAIDFATFKAAFKNKKPDESRLDMLKAEHDGLIETEAWDFDDIVTTDCSNVEVVDAILYYVTGFLSRRMTKLLPCTKCRQSLSVATPSKQEADLLLCKTRGFDSQDRPKKAPAAKLNKLAPKRTHNGHSTNAKSRTPSEPPLLLKDFQHLTPFQAQLRRKPASCQAAEDGFSGQAPGGPVRLATAAAPAPGPDRSTAP
ncbi:hypothetical protein HPB50_008776 [Hyalomma asiaticum]|uniref:Uncharacterized protein n=1 Tax=Hyalomma asiaticum TaxID=266040 RepID=A0ACB7S5C1_HYAAI|nr:hypothetical protein HPB50_008776 [Hyalomma asiaticum]